MPAGSITVIAPEPTTSTVLSGADERRGVLVQPQADGEGIVGQRGQQPAQPVALAEVLVDDHPVGEPEPGGRRSRCRRGERRPPRRGRSCARRGTRRRPRCRPPARPAAFIRRSFLATAVPPRWVASRSWLPPVRKTPVDCAQPLQQVLPARSRDGLERKRLGAVDAQVGEDRLVAAAGVGGERGGGNDRDAGRACRPQSFTNRRRIGESCILSSAPPTGMM